MRREEREEGGGGEEAKLQRRNRRRHHQHCHHRQQNSSSRSSGGDSSLVMSLPPSLLLSPRTPRAEKGEELEEEGNVTTNYNNRTAHAATPAATTTTTDNTHAAATVLAPPPTAILMRNIIYSPISTTWTLSNHATAITTTSSSLYSKPNQHDEDNYNDNDATQLLSSRNPSKRITMATFDATTNNNNKGISSSSSSPTSSSDVSSLPEQQSQLLPTQWIMSSSSSSSTTKNATNMNTIILGNSHEGEEAEAELGRKHPLLIFNMKSNHCGEDDEEHDDDEEENEDMKRGCDDDDKQQQQQRLLPQRENLANDEGGVPPKMKNSTSTLPPPTTTTSIDARAVGMVVVLDDKQSEKVEQEEHQEEEQQEEEEEVDNNNNNNNNNNMIIVGAPASATTTSTNNNNNTANNLNEEYNEVDAKEKERKDDKNDEEDKDSKQEEEYDEDEYSNFMGMDLRRALPMLTESGSTIFEDTYCNSNTLANTTSNTATRTTTTTNMVIMSCEDDEEEDDTRISCNESSSVMSVRELRRVLPFVEEDDDAVYSLLDECADGDFEVMSTTSAGFGANAAATCSSSSSKGNVVVGDDNIMMTETRRGNGGKNFVLGEVGRIGVVGRGGNHHGSYSNSNGRLSSSFPSLMDRYSSLSASASTVAQPPTLATTHQYHKPYSEEGDEDDDEVENGGEKNEEEVREGDSPGNNYNSHTNINPIVARNDQDPLMATLSRAIEASSSNDVEYHKKGNNGDVYITTTRIADGGTTTTMRMIPSPQDQHLNPHQQQERHLQIHHHHHQIHHHYHYRAPPLPPPPPPLQSSSLAPPEYSSTSTLDITAHHHPPPSHIIDVVGASTQGTSIQTNHKMKIPVYDDMIVDLERINEEQSSGSVGGGTTTTPSSRSTNAASRGERRRQRLQQENDPSVAQVLHNPNEQVLKQLPTASRTTPQHLADQRFFAYRHQYYMEQYHYYDDTMDRTGLAAHSEDTSHGNNSRKYNEYDQYDHDDNDDDDNEYEEETIHSTCSSVTLSQAFHPDGIDVSCSSSLTEEYYNLHPPPPTTTTTTTTNSTLPLLHDVASLGDRVSGGGSITQRRRRMDIGRATSTISRESCSDSTLSSVTLSRALGRDVNRHEHEHPSYGGGGGFYVATRLGDFVQQEEDEEALPGTTAIIRHVEESKEKVDKRDGIGDIRTTSTVTVKANDSNSAAGQGKTPILESPNKQCQHQYKYTSITSNRENDFEIETVLSHLSVAGSYKEDRDNNNTKNIDKEKYNNGVTTQITSTLEEISTDILTSIIPECGVPIQSVMAKVGGRSRGYGMLLPWHSTRSIQNYHRSGSSSSNSSKRIYKKRGVGGASSDSSMASGRREGNIFSMSSVHTFRG